MVPACSDTCKNEALAATQGSPFHMTGHVILHTERHLPPMRPIADCSDLWQNSEKGDMSPQDNPAVLEGHISFAQDYYVLGPPAVPHMLVPRHSLP